MASIFKQLHNFSHHYICTFSIAQFLPYRHIIAFYPKRLTRKRRIRVLVSQIGLKALLSISYIYQFNLSCDAFLPVCQCIAK